MMKSNAVRFGAVLLPLLLSQSGAFAATRDHAAATAPRRAAVVHVHQPVLHAAPGNAIWSAMPHHGTTDMSDMWPYYLDLG
jgi:hypothetical protein